jgi:hypothetical protein
VIVVLQRGQKRQPALLLAGLLAGDDAGHFVVFNGAQQAAHVRRFRAAALFVYGWFLKNLAGCVT